VFYIDSQTNVKEKTCQYFGKITSYLFITRQGFIVLLLISCIDYSIGKPGFASVLKLVLNI